jgi:hypothetical protein
MPFNPTLPANNSPVVSAELRNQFTGLKELIDALGPMLVPIGTVLMWERERVGTPALPPNFVECNGQTLDDPESPYDGQPMPDHNLTGRFPRAGSGSGQFGGFDSFGTATAEAFSNTPVTVVSPDFSPGASPIPPYVTFVFVIRVK